MTDFEVPSEGAGVVTAWRLGVHPRLPLLPRPPPRQVKELGRGCFGSVWLAKWRGVEVALKEMLHQVRHAPAG